MLGQLPATLNLTLGAGLVESAGLRPGQPVQALVRMDAQGAPFVRVGSLNIPLPTASNWTAGQKVSLVFTTDAPTPQIQVTALPLAPPSTSAAPSGNPATALARIVANLLPALETDLSPDMATRLLPGVLPVSTTQIAPQLGLLLSSQPPGDGLAAMVRWLSNAKGSGTLSPAALEATETLLKLEGLPASDWSAAIKLAAHEGGIEARLAMQGAKGEEQSSLRSLIASLLSDDTVRAYMAGEGVADAFEDTAQSLLSRLDAAAVAGLRGLEQPYRFFEIPFAWLLGFTRAQVHLMEEQGRGQGNQEKQIAPSLVLDLELESLGALWVSLKRTPDACRCDISADREDTRRLLNENKADLVTALADAGLPSPTVLIHVWQAGGERASRLAALFVPQRPLDVDA